MNIRKALGIVLMVMPTALALIVFGAEYGALALGGLVVALTFTLAVMVAGLALFIEN
jgi:hypothetical protein